jgi:metallophosphoesterase superfamily enzyme
MAANGELVLFRAGLVRGVAGHQRPAAGIDAQVCTEMRVAGFLTRTSDRGAPMASSAIMPMPV